MTEEEIRRRVASPEVLQVVIKSLQRSRRLREQAPEWLQKISTTKERLILAFGRTLVQRCQAKNQRGQQCAKTAIRNKSVCRFHGGRSTGATSEAGKQRSRKANWVHGNRSAEAMMKASKDAARIRELADALRVLNALNTDERFRGVWPKQYTPIHDMAGVEELVQKLVIEQGE